VARGKIQSCRINIGREKSTSDWVRDLPGLHGGKGMRQFGDLHRRGTGSHHQPVCRAGHLEKPLEQPRAALRPAYGHVEARRWWLCRPGRDHRQRTARPQPSPPRRPAAFAECKLRLRRQHGQGCWKIITERSGVPPKRSAGGHS